MKTLAAGLAGLLLAVQPVAALAGDAALEAPINQFLAAFNKGDNAGAVASAVPTGVTITDEFAPYHWDGAKAFATWTANYETDAKAKGITEPAVKLGAPTRELVTGADAYVVSPAVYTFKQKGVAMREVAQMTFALNKGASGWKIAAWTWTGPNATPVK